MPLCGPRWPPLPKAPQLNLLARLLQLPSRPKSPRPSSVVLAGCHGGGSWRPRSALGGAGGTGREAPGGTQPSGAPVVTSLSGIPAEALLGVRPSLLPAGSTAACPASCMAPALPAAAAAAAVSCPAWAVGSRALAALQSSVHLDLHLILQQSLLQALQLTVRSRTWREQGCLGQLAQVGTRTEGLQSQVHYALRDCLSCNQDKSSGPFIAALTALPSPSEPAGAAFPISPSHCSKNGCNPADGIASPRRRAGAAQGNLCNKRPT